MTLCPPVAIVKHAMESVYMCIVFAHSENYSLVPRPSTPPICDRFQYAQTHTGSGGVEGLGTRRGN